MKKNFRYGMKEKDFFNANPFKEGNYSNPFDTRQNPTPVLMWFTPPMYGYSNPHVAGIFISGEEYGRYLSYINSVNKRRRR